MVSKPLPLRGGNAGGSDDDVGKVATSSAGAGDLDFVRVTLLPLARRSHDGLARAMGLSGRSTEERFESMDVED